MSKLLILSCKIVFVVPSEIHFLFSFHFFDQICTFDHKFKDILGNYRLSNSFCQKIRTLIWRRPGVNERAGALLLVAGDSVILAAVFNRFNFRVLTTN